MAAYQNLVILNVQAVDFGLWTPRHEIAALLDLDLPVVDIFVNYRVWKHLSLIAAQL